MKSILLCIDAYRTMHKYIAETFEYVLSSKYNIDKVYISNTLEICSDTNIQANVIYDFIICLNSKSYTFIQLQRIGIYNSPIIYVYCASDSVKEFPYIYSNFSDVICIQDGINTLPLNYSFINKIRIPILFRNTINIKERTKNKNIVFGCDDNVLIRISKTINKVDALFGNVVVVSSSSKAHRFLNKSITCINGLSDEIIKILNNASIVIGSGDIIAQAIATGISSIVIGECGYGGSITQYNYDLFHSLGFNGRIGGTPYEYIPEDLIITDIRISMNGDSVSPVYETFYGSKLKIFSKELEDIFQLNIENEKIDKEFQKYLRNSDFDIFPIGDNLYVITDIISGENLFILEEKEYEAINYFNIPTSLSKVLKSYDDPHFYEQLITNKFILPYG